MQTKEKETGGKRGKNMNNKVKKKVQKNRSRDRKRQASGQKNKKIQLCILSNYVL